MKMAYQNKSNWPVCSLHCKFYVLFGLHILHNVYQNLIYTDKLYALHMTLYAYSLNGGTVRAAARVTGQLAYAN